MESFFSNALNVVNGNVGVIPIVIIFAFSTIVTVIIKKTTTLNQKQSYGLLILIFIGLMTFLIAIYAMFLSPNDISSEQNNTSNENIVANNINLDANVSNNTNGYITNKNFIHGNRDSQVNIVNN